MVKSFRTEEYFYSLLKVKVKVYLNVGYILQTWKVQIFM